MDNGFFTQKRLQKMVASTLAAMIFTAAPVLSLSAAETTSQAEVSSVPTAPPGNTPSNTEAPPSQDASLPELPASQPPVDANTNTIIIQTSEDTVPAAPSPADQDTSGVTPMQSTVYAASQKGLNVRSGPSTSHSRLGTLQYGQSITVTGKTANNWYQIQYSGGIGYVLADLVSTAPPVTSQTPAAQNPSTEDPSTENPVPENPEETPPAAAPDNETGSEIQTQDSSSEEGNDMSVSQLIDTPVVIGLIAAILGVMALIGYTVYSLFKKSSDTADEYYEDDESYEEGLYSDDEYYEDDERYPDGGYYEEELFSDDEYYADEPYSDDEYYADEPYPDDEYSGEEPYSNDEYYEEESYPDDEYYEEELYSDDEYYDDNEPYSDEDYYEDNDKRR